MAMTAESRMDALARDLAGGRVSRRTALSRFIGGAAGFVLPSALIAEPALARCPPSRKCGSKCCPPGSRCRDGRCQCKRRLTTCSGKCVNLGSDVANCGVCGLACGPGQTCEAGKCTGGSAAQQSVCGNGVREVGEICDGADLGTHTCQSLGFVSGSLACAANCTLDASGCVSRTCTTAAGCPPGPGGNCRRAVCVSGTCGFVNDDTVLPADDGNPCATPVCANGVLSQTHAAAGTACGSGGMVCNGSGGCVGCNTAADCPGTNTECRTKVCTNGTCSFSFTTASTPTSQQTAGDCRRNVCDGNGNIVSAADNADTPNDANPCTADTCASGAPVFTSVPDGTGCRAATGLCDAGSICQAGMCVDNFHPAGTVCRPAAGVCDVAESCTGNSATCPADQFLPAGTQCRPATGPCDVAESCTGNSATCPADGFAPAGTPCGPVGAACNGMGACMPPEVCNNGVDDDGDGQIDEGCPPVCGNGIVEAGEQCDDGNLVDGDGCSSTCQIEPGFRCRGRMGRLSVCTPIA